MTKGHRCTFVVSTFPHCLLFTTPITVSHPFVFLFTYSLCIAFGLCPDTMPYHRPGLTSNMGDQGLGMATLTA